MPDTEKKKLISFSETPANLQLSNEAEYHDEELWRSRRITPSEISIILHMIRKPNSIIVLLFIQNNS